MANVLVTGGGRGFGLALVSLLAALPESTISKIIVTTRGNPSENLRKIMEVAGKRIIHIECEVVNAASVKRAAAEIEEKLGGQGLDMLINNIGKMGVNPQGIRTMDADELIQEFNVNVAAAHRVTAALIPLLQLGKLKKIIMVSSSAGSIAWADRYTFSPAYAYKITKAAMNMLAVQYAIEYEKDGFTILTISPGWLKTDMGSEKADLDVDTGAKAVWDLANKADVSYNGKFYNIHVPGWEHNPGVNQYNGLEIPW
ncbi:uncharacterized protein TRIVIDRAFT_41881 [Trichoderma virens Gv29-8]|uniref:Uncharacterized protein n=1 Tax=Hypocrea virens (strain Gv29-8 / FGSC 10586) TaxID=413071 RepID=G9N8L1_HYPVG|nr:uncharacterized protein TRIVIDRAFT_41881 [Trichoderma virens Gv29-8]EHK17317.1 hypothetical protein TRIVIDRAFT_41881 [Trichoderma virens Gv29-8]UKZ55734.1 hypothetical protein TrVGV298_009558 [Trichoderma virens]